MMQQKHLTRASTRTGAAWPVLQPGAFNTVGILPVTSKDLSVPARDAQAILGHARISTTLEIYTNVDGEARRDALTRLHGLLDETHSPAVATDRSCNPAANDLET
jgi:hypothetical protein